MPTDAPLTPAEVNELAELEATVDDAKRRATAAFVDIFLPLGVIRDRKLYRGRDGRTTFDEYVLERHGITRYTAFRGIEAARKYQALAEQLTARNLPLPQGERHLRPLVSLPDDVALAVWALIVETAPEGKVTAAHAERVTQRFKTAEPKVRQLISEGDPYPSPKRLATEAPEAVIRRSQAPLRAPRTELERLAEIARRRGFESVQGYLIDLINDDIRRNMPEERPLQTTVEWQQTTRQALEILNQRRVDESKRLQREAEEVLAAAVKEEASLRPRRRRRNS